MRGWRRNECVSDIHKWRFFWASFTFRTICRQYFCHTISLFVVKVKAFGHKQSFSFCSLRTDPLSPVEHIGSSSRNRIVIKRIILHYVHQYAQIFVRKYIINKTHNTLPTCFNRLSCSPLLLAFFVFKLSRSIVLKDEHWNNWMENVYEFLPLTLRIAIKCFCHFMSWTLFRLFSTNGQFTSIIFASFASTTNAHNP